MLGDLFIPVKAVLVAKPESMSINTRYIEFIREKDDKHCVISMRPNANDDPLLIVVECSKSELEKKIQDEQIRLISKIINGAILKIGDIKGGE